MFGVWCMSLSTLFVMVLSQCVFVYVSLLWMLCGWGSYIFGHVSSSTGTEDALLPKLQVCTQHSPRYVF